MAQQKEAEPKRIPKFQDEQEASEFWDTHSPLDFPEEFKEVEAKFARPLIKHGLTIKLGDDTLGQLRVLARERGIGPSTLVRMWILEHLRGQKAHASAP